MRITSWNLLHGQGATNFRAIADALDVGNSDFVIGVQEVDAFQDRSDQVFQVADLARELGANNFAFVRCVIGTPGFKWRKIKSDEALLMATLDSTNINSTNIAGEKVLNIDNPPAYGIGLITNIPVKKWEVLALGKSVIGMPLVFPAGNADSTNTTNVSVRPKLRFIYVKDEPRYAVAAQLENGFTVVNMHLSFVPFVNLFQLWRVKRWLAKMPGKHILLGDLNLPFDLPVKFSKWKSLVSIASYPTWQPKIQFDYILSDNFGVDNFGVDKSSKDSIKPIYLRSDISDHLPVTIEIN